MIQYWREQIARALKRGSITRTQELMGYTLSNRALTAKYAPDPAKAQEPVVAAPEFLTGNLTNYRV